MPMGQKVGVAGCKRRRLRGEKEKKNAQFLIFKCKMKIKTIISSRLLTMTPWSIQTIRLKPHRWESPNREVQGSSSAVSLHVAKLVTDSSHHLAQTRFFRLKGQQERRHAKGVVLLSCLCLGITNLICMLLPWEQYCNNCNIVVN